MNFWIVFGTLLMIFTLIYCILGGDLSRALPYSWLAYFIVLYGHEKEK